jgi:transposase
LKWQKYELWTPTPQPIGRIEYNKLRRINPEAARRAVIEYLKSNGHNISQGAQVFGINRTVIYDFLRTEKEDNLKDRSRAPHHQPRRTPAQIEDQVIKVKCQTRYGAERLSRYLKQQEGLSLPPGQSGISSGETERRSPLLSGMRSGRRGGNLSTSMRPNPLRSYR